MNLPFSQACENNKQPILDVLQRVFVGRRQILEIGSGTGQHATFFASQLAPAIWQTSDRADNHQAINAWLTDRPAANLRAPLALDVDMAQWPIAGVVDAVFTANTCHIMAWSSVENMFARLSVALAVGGVLAIYGPFNYDNQYTSESNARFDSWLKAQALHQGIRDFAAVNDRASAAGMALLEDNTMPANNRLLVWLKTR